MNETDNAPVAETTARRPWEPLGFEKIAAADAELNPIFAATDGGFTYS